MRFSSESAKALLRRNGAKVLRSVEELQAYERVKTYHQRRRATLSKLESLLN